MFKKFGSFLYKNHLRVKSHAYLFFRIDSSFNNRGFNYCFPVEEKDFILSSLSKAPNLVSLNEEDISRFKEMYVDKKVSMDDLTNSLNSVILKTAKDQLAFLNKWKNQGMIGDLDMLPRLSSLMYGIKERIFADDELDIVESFFDLGETLEDFKQEYGCNPNERVVYDFLDFTPSERFLDKLERKCSVYPSDYDLAKRFHNTGEISEQDLIESLEVMLKNESRRDFNAISKRSDCFCDSDLWGYSLAFGIHKGEFNQDEMEFIAQKRYANNPITNYLNRPESMNLAKDTAKKLLNNSKPEIMDSSWEHA